MPEDELQTTWDGQPIAPEPPHGASIVVHRWCEGERTFLALHRSHEGPDYEGDWAWDPPAGCRWPGEPIDECARRELAEETGLELLMRSIGANEKLWATYLAEAPADAEVVLDGEHDRFAWLTLPDFIERCAPEVVADAVRRAAAAIRVRS